MPNNSAKPPKEHYRDGDFYGYDLEFGGMAREFLESRHGTAVSNLIRCTPSSSSEHTDLDCGSGLWISEILAALKFIRVRRLVLGR